MVDLKGNEKIIHSIDIRLTVPFYPFLATHTHTYFINNKWTTCKILKMEANSTSAKPKYYYYQYLYSPHHVRVMLQCVVYVSPEPIKQN